MKTKIENGIEYILKNDIWYPNLKMKEEGISLGKYGLMRKNYLDQHAENTLNTLLIKGELYTHCKEVEGRVNEMFETLYNQALQKGYGNVQAANYAEEVVFEQVLFS